MTDPRAGDERAGEKPFQFTDRRRIDPETGARREVPGAPMGTPGDAAASADPADSAQPLSVDQQHPEVETARQEAADRLADLQRVTAEYANYRKRVDRDREQVVAGARATVLTELLGVLDDVDRAESHGDLVGAFKAVADKLTDTLGRLGLERLGEPGETFDPSVHEAVQFSTSAHVHEPTVTEVLRHGYTVSGRLVRPVVVVVTGPENDTPSEPAGPEADGTEGGAPTGGDAEAGDGGSGDTEGGGASDGPATGESDQDR